jgi:hypothetical protein
MSIAVERALYEIAERHGGKLTPGLVVDAAKSKDSPLHPFFTWDVKKAAAERLLDQARSLIRSVTVEITTTQFSMRAPVYVRDPEAPGNVQGYTSLSRLRTDEDLAREVITSEFARASAILTRAKAIAAALSLEGEIESVRSQLDELSTRARTVEYHAEA